MTSLTITKDASTQTTKILRDIPTSESDELIFLMTTPQKVSHLEDLANQVDDLKNQISSLQQNYHHKMMALHKQIELLTSRIKCLTKEASYTSTALINHIQKTTKPSLESDEIHLHTYLELLDNGYLPYQKNALLIRDLNELLKIEKIKGQRLGIIHQIDDEVVICDAFKTPFEYIIEARVIHLSKHPAQPQGLFKK